MQKWQIMPVIPTKEDGASTIVGNNLLGTTVVVINSRLVYYEQLWTAHIDNGFQYSKHFLDQSLMAGCTCNMSFFYELKVTYDRYFPAQYLKIFQREEPVKFVLKAIK